jgi:hypothetical protein
MAFAVARTRDEAHLYLDLHPCDACGSVETAWTNVVAVADGTPATRYTGSCGGCGAEREFWFGLPERPVLPEGYPTFGGPEPSQLLDAGQWWWVADVTAGDLPAGDDAEARRSLAIARAAVEEVLKFIPPGEDAVPETAFWSEQGRRAYEEGPSRFTLDHLLAARTAYRERAADHAEERGGR